MTDTSNTEFEITNVSAPASRLAYEVINGKDPFTRHVIALDVENGLEVHTIDEEENQPFPRRARGERVVSELDSFLAELSRRQLGPTGTLWGTATAGKLTAVYNDHDPAPHVGGWRDDTLAFQLKADPDWAAWHKLSGHYFPQQQFGDLVEELLHTIQQPDQAELLEIIDSIRASSKGSFESGITRATGAQKLTYNTEISATAGKSTKQLEVPQFVTLRIRPWDGHPTFYDVDAYFRLKIDNGHLLLTIKLKPTRQIIRDAWTEITETVTQAIGKPVYAQ